MANLVKTVLQIMKNCQFGSKLVKECEKVKLPIHTRVGQCCSLSTPFDTFNSLDTDRGYPSNHYL